MAIVWRARKQIILRVFNRWIRAHMLWWGRERRGLSAYSPSPRAKHPNPRSRNHERPRIHAKRRAQRGKKMDDSFSHTSSRKRRVMRRRFSQNYIQIPKTACVNPKHIILLICADHSERWNARTAVDSGETPWHFTARRTKFHWGSRRSANGWSQKGKLVQKSQQRRAMWPLREGREIWGVDGAFASMTWRRHCVSDGVVPSANKLAWFYLVSDSVTQKAFPMRKLRSVELPMKENIFSDHVAKIVWIVSSQFPENSRFWRWHLHCHIQVFLLQNLVFSCSMFSFFFFFFFFFAFFSLHTI